MEISSDLIFYINIFVVVYMIYITLKGLKNGFLKQIFRTWAFFLGIIMFFSVGYLCYDAFFMFKVSAKAEVADFVANNYLNAIFWFFVFVISVRIIFAMFYRYFIHKFNQKRYGAFSRIIGAIIGCLNGFVTICITCTILSFPLFSNGKDIIDDSYLKIGKQGASFSESFIKELILESHTYIDYKKTISKDTDKLIELEKIFK